MNRMLHRLLIKWYLAIDSELPKWLREKCEKEETLKALWKEENSLTGALSNSRPKEDDVDVSPFLEGRILRAIEEEQREAERPRQSWGLGPLYTFGGLAAVAAVVTIIVSNAPLSPTPEGGLAAEDAALVESAVSGLASVDLDSVNQLVQPDWQNPLDREIENVLVDGKRALSFLAENFVPSDVVEEWGLSDA